MTWGTATGMHYRDESLETLGDVMRLNQAQIAAVTNGTLKGVRLEDLILVTDAGADVLTTFPYDFEL